MAIEFSARGWKVSGGARDQSRLSSLERELKNDFFLGFLDVTIPEKVETFAGLAKDNFGPPDLLVNNAGLINRNAALLEISPEEFSAVLAVNLGGIHNMIRSFLPMMLAKNQGIIVNFSSYWGQSAAPEVGPYCASKWGVEGLTRSLAQELPMGMAAVAFNPGVINTDMLKSCFGEDAAEHEDPKSWAIHAVDRLESVSPSANGETVLG